MRCVRQAHGSDHAGRPGLFDDPGAGVVAIDTIAQILHIQAFRFVAAAAVLIDHDVTTAHEESGNLRAALWLLDRRRALGATVRRLVVRRALENDGETLLYWSAIAPGNIRIGRQAHTVAHRHHDVAENDDFEAWLLSGVRGRNLSQVGTSCNGKGEPPGGLEERLSEFAAAQGQPATVLFAHMRIMGLR